MPDSLSLAPRGEPAGATRPVADLRVDSLAVVVCRTLRDMGGEQATVTLDRLADRLGSAGATSLDAAIAFASAKGWLTIVGAPATRVLLTRAAPPA